MAVIFLWGVTLLLVASSTQRHQDHTYFIAVVIASAYFFEPSVAEDPSGATDCTTQWNKDQNLLYCLLVNSNSNSL